MTAIALSTYFMVNTEIYKVKAFARWMRSNSISNNDLLRSVKEIEGGLIDAELGGGLCKKRISVQGRGKRSWVQGLF
ncbi:MAG: type II toxin-antitoxin system RelE/ParE family toxin [Bdellovibrionota bacterium]